MIKDRGERSRPFPVNRGIRQGDLLSPLLLNIIIKSASNNKGFKIGDGEIKIMCYTDDAVLLSDKEDDLQKMLFNFNKVAKTFNMKTANEKVNQ